MNTRMQPCAVTFAACAVALASLAVPNPAAAQVEHVVPSTNTLTTGNGFGFQLYDGDQNAVTSVLERPYRFLHEHPEFPDGDGVLRRDLAHDTYFGLQSAAGSPWLGGSAPESFGYVNGTNIVRSTVTRGPLRAHSHFYAPFGFAGNAMVMVLEIENSGGEPAQVTPYSVHNFLLGSADDANSPGVDGERIRGVGDVLIETGPGGGHVLYVPLEEATPSCDAGAWAAVAAGNTIQRKSDCNGDDLAAVFQGTPVTLAPGSRTHIGVAILLSMGGDETAGSGPEALLAAWNQFAAGRNSATLLADAIAEWDAWRTTPPAGLSDSELATWRQSEAVLRMGQVLEPWSEEPKRKGHGMVLASLPPGIWHIGWVRDAAYALVAMADTGHHREARAGLDFFLNAEAGLFKEFLRGVDYRISTVRYFGNGVEEADFSGKPSRNIEIDGWGLYLWAARRYLEASGDYAWLDSRTRHGDTVYEALRSGVADPIVTNLEPEGMAIADASIWEVHWDDREHFTYTTAAVARGLCDMAAIASARGDEQAAHGYRYRAQAAVRALRRRFTDSSGVLASSIERLERGYGYRDGAVVEAFNWRLFDPQDRVTEATLDDLSFLTTPVGGFRRIETSTDTYDTNEWVFVDLRAADALRDAGEPGRADELIESVTARAAVNHNLIAELYNADPDAGAIGQYTGSIPMNGYGAGIYMLSLARRAGMTPASDCGGGEGLFAPRDEDQALSGGGCSTAGAHSTAPLATLFLVGLVVARTGRRRQRRRADEATEGR